MAIKEFLDRTGFTQPGEVMDLYGNYIRSGLKFNSYGDKTDFDAVVLSAPIFLLDADISSNTRAAGREGGKMNKFGFKARVINSPSPHDYLPDPCDTDIAENTIKATRIINMHTTFFSKDDYTRTSNMIPKVGDIVRVRLKKNVFSFNVQYGEFLSLKTYSTADTDLAGQCKTTMTSFYAGSPVIPGVPFMGGQPSPADDAARNAIMDLFWQKIKDHNPACKAVQSTGITSRGRTIAYGNRMIMCWGDKTKCKNPDIPNNGNFNDAAEVERVRQALRKKGYKIASPADSNHCVGAGCKGGGGKPIIAFDIGCGTKCKNGPAISKCLKAFRDDTGPKGHSALIKTGVLKWKFCLDCEFTSLTHGKGKPPPGTPPDAGEGGWNQETANGAVHIEIVPA